jgi:hypothetical protein
MPRQQAQTRARTVDILEEEYLKPDLVLVRSRIYIHGRREDGPGDPCPCCGSPHAEIVEEIDDEQVLIKTATRERVLRSQVADQDKWERACAGAHVVDQRFTLSDHVDPETGYSDLDVFLDEDTPVWAVTGGNRSGKTHLGAQRLIRAWIRRGGDGHLFRIMSLRLGQSHMVMKKLVQGEGGAAPMLDPVLVTYYPKTEDTRDQHIRLIDGTAIGLTYAGDGEHLKGVKCQYTHWTEVTACAHASAFTVALARAIDDRGQLYLDSTPRAGHWLKGMYEDAIRNRRDELTALQRGEKPKRPHTRAVSKSVLDNPWQDQEYVKLAWEAAKAQDPIGARRDWGGEWVGNNATIFGEVWDPLVHVVDMYNGPSLESLGLRDVTREASRRFFGGAGHDWVCGVDVNRNPHTAVICKVYEHPKTPGAFGLLIWDEVRTYNCSAYGAAVALRNKGSDVGVGEGAYKGCGVAIDATAAHENQHTAHTGGRRTTPVKDYNQLGFNCRPNYHPKSGKPANPGVADSTALLRHLMRQTIGPRPDSDRPVPRILVNAANCSGVIHAIESQEDRGDGTPVKESGKASDYLIAAFTDSLRYIAWPLFSDAVYSKPSKARTFA